METESDEIIEGRAEPEIGRSHGDARRHLHAVLARQQRPHISDHAVVTAAAALGGTLPVMNGAHAVEAHGPGEAVALEKLGVVSRQERTVGGDRKPDRYALLACHYSGELGGPSYQRAIDQRLATEKGEGDPFAGLRFAQQASHRRLGDLQRHVACRAAEAAAFGIAIGATEIATLRHGQRQRAHRRVLEGFFTDEALAPEAVRGEDRADRLLAFSRRCRELALKIFVDLEELRSVDEQKMRALFGLEQVNIRCTQPRIARRRTETCAVESVRHGLGCPADAGWESQREKKGMPEIVGAALSDAG